MDGSRRPKKVIARRPNKFFMVQGVFANQFEKLLKC